MKAYTFRAIIEPDEDGYHGYVPALPGCHTCGDTIEETKENLREALTLFMASLLDDGEPIPEEDFIEFHPTITEEEVSEIRALPRSAASPSL